MLRLCPQVSRALDDAAAARERMAPPQGGQRLVLKPRRPVGLSVEYWRRRGDRDGRLFPELREALCRGAEVGSFAGPTRGSRSPEPDHFVNLVAVQSLAADATDQSGNDVTTQPQIAIEHIRVFATEPLVDAADHFIVRQVSLIHLHYPRDA